MLKSGLEFDDENIYQIPGAYQVKQEISGLISSIQTRPR
jgi:hypothetical protein